METYLNIASCFLSNSWRVLTTVKMPGLDVSIAHLCIALFLIGLGLRIFSYALGLSLPIVNPSGKVPNNPSKHYGPPSTPNRIGSGRSLMKR